MSKQQFTIVYYYVPEDLDQFTQLNAFVIRKKIDEIRLPDIVTEFPMQGAYHFRFRCNVQKNRQVWLDLNNTTCKLPLSDDGKIIMKVTRITWTQAAQQPAAASFAKILEEEEKNNSNSQIQQPAQPTPAQASNPNLIGFQTIVDKPVEITKPADFKQQAPSQKELVQPSLNPQSSGEKDPGVGMFGAMPEQSSGSASPENHRMRMSGGGQNLLNLDHSPLQKPQPANNLLLEGLENLKF